jgi:glycolate oxidase FAD binding subunit
MLERDLAAGLRAAAGESALEEHAPREVDGVRIGATLRPPDAEALARSLACLGRSGAAALVRGAGTGLALGNPPRDAAVFLSTERLAGVGDFDPDEGVCRARAGTPLAALRAEVEAGGWELPFDPPADGATLGGTLAAAALGPRVQGYGMPRDLVLGLEVSLATGERTHCGGRVVKNVTGYDLNKLYTGCLGSLGVIEAAWLRLRPLPAETRVLEAEAGGCEGWRAGVAAARRWSARAVALLDSGAGDRLVVELAGDGALVERDGAWLAQEHGAQPADGGALDAVRRRQRETPGDKGLRFRIAGLVSQLGEVLALLGDAGARTLAYPGLGLVYAGFEVGGDGDAAARAFDAAGRAARVGRGSWILEAGPVSAKRGRDVFGEAPGALPLMRAMKERFDPHGVLNPGRFMGFV